MSEECKSQKREFELVANIILNILVNEFSKSKNGADFVTISDSMELLSESVIFVGRLFVSPIIDKIVNRPVLTVEAPVQSQTQHNHEEENKFPPNKKQIKEKTKET
jgi:hypothetical protein